MTKKQKTALVRIVISAALFLIASALNIKYLLFASFAVAGYDVIFGAAIGIKNRQVLDEKFLMSVATVGALIIEQYHEAVFVMLFYQVGELFQSIAVGKSRKSISHLINLYPESATLVKGDSLITVSPSEVKVGDTILVRAGEKIALDGVVAQGSGDINTSSLTGESQPVFVDVGNKVMSGCVSENAVLYIKVTAEFENSTVAKILELVESSALNKAKSETFITKFARIYTPAVVIAALVIAILPPILSIGAWTDWVYRAMTFLVISCPCALVISVPLCYFCAIGSASKKGILVKGAAYLETLALCDTVVFDKTGTLTNGKFSVSRVCAVGVDSDMLLKYAASAESMSNHPLAKSISEYYTGELFKTSDAYELAGLGTHATIDGKTVCAGNKNLMQSIGITNIPTTTATAVYVACDSEFLGHIEFCDDIKVGAKTALDNLKILGIKNTVMLTGDKQEVANSVGKTLGIDKVYAGLLPADKAEIIKSTPNCAFVGDGINDAPALALGNVGIAMGGIGSDAAIEAADIVIMDDDIKKIPKSISLARATRGIVSQNIVFVLAVKALILILGLFGIAGMWAATFADVGVAVIAILNSARIFSR